MTPDWEINYKNFYIFIVDFFETSLRDFHLIIDLKMLKFINLSNYRYYGNKKFTKFNFKFFSEITRIIVPDYFKKYKWVKFSKEIILLSIAKK